jgi:cell division initiation protein
MEIRNQQFSKSMRGYSEEEVKSFLQQLAQDFESLYMENSQLKENMQRLKFELDKYNKIEETMNNSLILAQQTAETLKANAQQEADMILENSKRIIADTLTAYQEVIKRLNMFSLELKSQLSTELEMIEKNQNKTEELSNLFFSQDIKDLMVNLNKLKVEEKA